ncbi:hypothetical protein PSECIP111854_00503 [Pseudoalteromonas sp. CIP111854]|uniref:Probable inorganic carbon transporter subunit DabA n=1 Tax=Pseudoalteromonas holothuriae TaxID=2963714 RepID=A0A9W4VRH4_9GAMM|nr:DUF2309 domain-containing protein [Pseudoalteromonas sp. CIP111854]CAH9050303.1 hypothetical protein PSECIP111854_00503 [Pseudoalteromonas sp. CIP111854]
MNTALNTAHLSKTPALLETLQNVSLQVAPSWPLDQMIAVNPYWQMRDMPIEQVATQLKATSNIDLLWPCKHYVVQYHEGHISTQAIEQALQAHPTLKHLSVSQFVIESTNTATLERHDISFTSYVEQQSSNTQLSISQELNSHISQFCAWYFQHHDSQPSQQLSGHLYSQYQNFVAQDQGLSMLLDIKALHKKYADLPESAQALISQCEQAFELPNKAWPYYAQNLLLQLNGWASWVAYLNWQANLYGKPAAWHLDLIAIKLGWELVLFEHLQQQDSAEFVQTNQHWQFALEHFEPRLSAIAQHQSYQFVWWRAKEIEYQTALAKKLQTPAPQNPQQSTQLQAVFCIDVRSEVLRRHLERQDAHIETHGFAGFFGLPIELKLKDNPLKRPQLPGSLAPVLSVSPINTPYSLISSGHQAGSWDQVFKHPASSLPIVESAGWLALVNIIKRTIYPKKSNKVLCAVGQTDDWLIEQEGLELSTAQKADLAQKVLHLLGFKTYAPVVLLVGHASHNENNLHAASLDCGACGGQSGEVNVRVLCALLNDENVRNELANRHVALPNTTRFTPAIHNTTTDEVTLLSQEREQISQWLNQATIATQKERAISQSQANEQDIQSLPHTLNRRQLDWSETRPEWGLANNSAFIIGPRELTRATDFNGRTFLHSYDESLDTDGSTLELLLTAPMLVTNWINMQYNASVTAPDKLGSGNKVLHNAVGGHIGVFEGQGGDLRVGLPLQSVHNGHEWMHEPMRLTVVVRASKTALEHIINKHPDVKQLIDNGWIYLWQWSNTGLQQWSNGKWKVR